MKSAVKITVIYILIASLWIILSDRAITLFTDRVDVLTTYSSIKGLIYVAITSLMLFVMIKKEIIVRNGVIADLNKFLKIKEELIQELHHRIRNNIQVILGVLGLETEGEDFSAQAKDRIIKRLVSMQSVYNVVYNYENMKEISLENVLMEYERTESRNIAISAPASPAALPIETMVTLLLVLDVLLESLRDMGYGDRAEISALEDHSIELRLPGYSGAGMSRLLGPDESFVRTYLKSIHGDVSMTAGDPAIVRISYQ